MGAVEARQVEAAAVEASVQVAVVAEGREERAARGAVGAGLEDADSEVLVVLEANAPASGQSVGVLRGEEVAAIGPGSGDRGEGEELLVAGSAVAVPAPLEALTAVGHLRDEARAVGRDLHRDGVAVALDEPGVAALLAVDERQAEVS